MTTSECGVNQLRLTKQEYESLSEESQRQYAAQLKSGELNCGWRP